MEEGRQIKLRFPEIQLRFMNEWEWNIIIFPN